MAPIVGRSRRPDSARGVRFGFLSASLIALTMVLVAVGCGTSSSTSPAGATQTGTLTVMLKDSPFSDAQALLVTFSEVSVHASGGSFVTLPFSGGTGARTCDLKKLTGAQDVLGTAALPAGHYTQIRLTVSSASVYFGNASSGAACAASIAAPPGKSASVDIPSGQIILNREFDLTNGTTTTLLLDFDGDKSMRQLGNGTYQLSPVISIVGGG